MMSVTYGRHFNYWKLFHVVSERRKCVIYKVYYNIYNLSCVSYYCHIWHKSHIKSDAVKRLICDKMVTKTVQDREVAVEN